MTITTTSIFRKQESSVVSQAITTQLNLNDFDIILCSTQNGYNDANPCNSFLVCKDGNDLLDYISNVANAYNEMAKITVTEHKISSYYWFSVDGVKFT